MHCFYYLKAMQNPNNIFEFLNELILYLKTAT
nr:MAG TPA: hypothetical protein [Caudoviricetes sp.]